MDKAEYEKRFYSLPFVEQKRLLNTVTYINKFHPIGAELHSLLDGLLPAARQLLGDMVRDKTLAQQVVPLAVKKSFCNYCKKYTDHKVWSLPNKEGTGGDLTCSVCGSQRMDTIQGFDANLM